MSVNELVAIPLQHGGLYKRMIRCEPHWPTLNRADTSHCVRGSPRSTGHTCRRGRGEWVSAYDLKVADIYGARDISVAGFKG